MPAADYKGPKKQLNVWVMPETGDFLRQFSKEQGLSIGKAVDLIIAMLKDSQANED